MVAATATRVEHGVTVPADLWRRPPRYPSDPLAIAAAEWWANASPAQPLRECVAAALVRYELRRRGVR